MPPPAGPVPRIVVTLTAPARQAEPQIAVRKNALYVDSVVRHGAAAIALDRHVVVVRAGCRLRLDGRAPADGRHGHRPRPGTGQAEQGSLGTEPDRDALEAEAWGVADARGIPVLGICRGLQAMNVFWRRDARSSTSTDTPGRAGATAPPPRTRCAWCPESRLARILSPSGVGGSVLDVNSYHHQGVRPADLVAAVRRRPRGRPARSATWWRRSRPGRGRSAMGVQCHPERTESTPKSFERLFSFFVDACRGPLLDR